MNSGRLKRQSQSTQPHLIDLIEFPVDYYTSYEWTHTNLRASTAASCVAARQTIQDYLAKGQREEATGSPPVSSFNPAPLGTSASGVPG